MSLCMHMPWLVSGALSDFLALYHRCPGLLCYHLLTQVCPLFAAVTLREDSAKRLERRARRVSACLSDYSLASDSGVFEPLTKRLGTHHLISLFFSTLARVLLVCTPRIHMEIIRF